MLFWIFVAITVISIGFGFFLFDKNPHKYDLISTAFSFIGAASAIITFIMIIAIAFAHVGVEATIAEKKAEYDSLVYQYTNDIYDNDNDLGKRELMADIQEWNEDLAYRKEARDDFWIGIFYPNIYDQFEFIELK